MENLNIAWIKLSITEWLRYNNKPRTIKVIKGIDISTLTKLVPFIDESGSIDGKYLTEFNLNGNTVIKGKIILNDYSNLVKNHILHYTKNSFNWNDYISKFQKDQKKQESNNKKQQIIEENTRSYLEIQTEILKLYEKETNRARIERANNRNRNQICQFKLS